MGSDFERMLVPSDCPPKGTPRKVALNKQGMPVGVTIFSFLFLGPRQNSRRLSRSQLALTFDTSNCNETYILRQEIQTIHRLFLAPLSWSKIMLSNIWVLFTGERTGCHWVWLLLVSDSFKGDVLVRLSCLIQGMESLSFLTEALNSQPAIFFFSLLGQGQISIRILQTFSFPLSQYV